MIKEFQKCYGTRVKDEGPGMWTVGEGKLVKKQS